MRFSSCSPTDFLPRLLLFASVSQENLLRLVNIEYSVRGQQDLLQPGRVMSAITALFALPTLSAVHRPSAALYTIIQLGIPSPVRSQQQRSLPLKASRVCVCVMTCGFFRVIFKQVFVKEGTLMKVSRKSRQPRHLFLVNAGTNL